MKKRPVIMEEGDAVLVETRELLRIISDLVEIGVDLDEHKLDDMASAHSHDCPVCRALLALDFFSKS